MSEKKTYDITKEIFQICGLVATIYFILETILRLLKLGYLLFTGGCEL